MVSASSQNFDFIITRSQRISISDVYATIFHCQISQCEPTRIGITLAKGNERMQEDTYLEPLFSIRRFRFGSYIVKNWSIGPPIREPKKGGNDSVSLG